MPYALASPEFGARRAPEPLRRRAGMPVPFSRKSGGAALSLGLFVPMMGVAGIWGPSAIACATLAVEEINRGGGVEGRELRLHWVNAADECEDIAQTTAEAVESGAIDAIVGVHTSSVRRAVIEGCQGRVPYVYTALYEGGERSCGVYALGETPEHQLRPAIDSFVKDMRARRWVFIGNDYVWPRVSHRLARSYVHEAGGTVLADFYVPMGSNDFSDIFTQLEEARPDAVLLSLVGQDAVAFNRMFGQAGWGGRTLRLSCAIEENMLLAIGAANTENLYVSAGYFGALLDDANMSFKERYHQRFGQRAPTLNSLGQSTYEGVQFAAALAQQSLRPRSAKQVAPFKGVRGIEWRGNSGLAYPIHLARADGHFFEVVKSF